MRQSLSLRSICRLKVWVREGFVISDGIFIARGSRVSVTISDYACRCVYTGCWPDCGFHRACLNDRCVQGRGIGGCVYRSSFIICSDGERVCGCESLGGKDWCRAI